MKKKNRTIDQAADEYVQRLFSKNSGSDGERGVPHVHSQVKKKRNQERFEDDQAHAKHGRLDHVSDLFVPDYLIEEESEFDIRRVINRSIDPVTGMPRDMRIPDGDFPEAKNYFDFVSNYLNPNSSFPFSRQAWIMLKLFAEMCPYCSDPAWFSDIMAVPVDYPGRDLPDRIQMLEYGVCPKCKSTKAEMIATKDINSYSECNLCIGQRAGKSTTVASGSSYVFHKYLKLPNLSAVCKGVQTSTVLTATFIGYRFTDAKDLLWAPIKTEIDQSPWFQKYHAMLDAMGEKYGGEFYKSKDEYLKYSHKNIHAYPAGPSKRGLRGRTRILAGTDEVGWFPQDDEGDRERAGAGEVYTALDRSLLTVRSEVRNLFKAGYSNFLPGMNINLSSPSSATDMIMTLVNQSEGSTTSLGLRLPTWEVSPMYTKDHEDIAKAYRMNPVTAERDYGANPPLNAAMFIDTTNENIAKCFSGKNRIGIKLLKRVEEDGTRTISAETKWLTPQLPTYPSIMAIDAGYSNNSFSVVVMHKEEKKQILDLIVEIPALDKSRIGYNSVYKRIMMPIIRAFNVKYLFADRWQSIALLHRASEEFGIIGQQYSVKYADFVMARSYLEEMSIVLPVLEMEPVDIRQVIDYRKAFLHAPSSHLFHQFMTVKDHGNTVTKGDRFTDDIFRAFVLGLSRQNDPKIAEKMAEYAKLEGRVQGNVMGAIAATYGRMGTGNRPMPIGIPHPEQAGQLVAVAYRGGAAQPSGALGHDKSLNNGGSLVVRVSGGGGGLGRSK